MNVLTLYMFDLLMLRLFDVLIVFDVVVVACLNV